MKPLLLLLICAINVSLLSAQKMDLPLGREIKVTDTYLIKGYSTRITKITTQDPNGVAKLMRDDTATVRINAECEVAGITEDGQEAVKLVTIRNAELVQQGTVVDLVPAGTSLKVEFGESGVVITKDGVPLPMETTAHLSNVIRAEGGMRTGVIMDPPGQVAVGDTWEMDTTAFRTMLGPLSSAVPKALEGKSTFVSIEDGGVRPEAIVVLEAHAEDAIGNLDGVQPTASDLYITVTVHAPLDKRYPLTRSITDTRMTTQFGGGPGSASVDFQSTVDLSFLR